MGDTICLRSVTFGQQWRRRPVWPPPCLTRGPDDCCRALRTCRYGSCLRFFSGRYPGSRFPPARPSSYVKSDHKRQIKKKFQQETEHCPCQQKRRLEKCIDRVSIQHRTAYPPNRRSTSFRSDPPYGLTRLSGGQDPPPGLSSPDASGPEHR